MYHRAPISELQDACRNYGIGTKAFELAIENFPFDDAFFGPTRAQRLITLNAWADFYNPNLAELLNEWRIWLFETYSPEELKRDIEPSLKFDYLCQAINEGKILSWDEVFTKFLEYAFDLSAPGKVTHIETSLNKMWLTVKAPPAMSPTKLKEKVFDLLKIRGDNFTQARKLFLEQWELWKTIQEEARQKARLEAEIAHAKKVQLESLREAGVETVYKYFLNFAFTLSSDDDLTTIEEALTESYEKRGTPSLDPENVKKYIFDHFELNETSTEFLRLYFRQIWNAWERLQIIRLNRTPGREESLDEIRHRVYGDDIN